MRDSFIFYRSFFEASKPLTTEMKAEFFEAILEYSFNQTETELQPMVKAMFSLVKPQLEANQKRYENGLKGGRGKTKTKPKLNQDQTKPKANKNVNENDNVNVNENEPKKPKKKKAEFIPPTIEEFKAWCDESGHTLDANHIFTYYSDADWHDAKGDKIKNWKQKVRGNWCKEDNKQKPQDEFNLGMQR